MAMVVGADETGCASVDDKSFLIVAGWQAEEGLSAAEVAKSLGLDLPPGVPEALVPTLVALTLAYDVRAKRLVLVAVTEHTSWLFASLSRGSTTLRAVAFRARLDARVSQLPVVGDAVPVERDLAVTGVRFTLASGVWTREQTAAVNGLAERVPEIAGGVRLPEEGLAAGVLVGVEWVVAGEPQPPLVLAPKDPPKVSPSAGLVGLGAQAGAAVSREMNLVLGPVRLQRVGLSYTAGSLFFAVDAVLALGPVELSLLGLGFGVNKRFEVSLALRGAGVVLDKPPVKVVGAVERRSDPGSDFVEVLDGLLTVEASAFALGAAGSYARSRAGWSSMFLFGELAATGDQGLFGPPAFTVTALCLGFGVNSTVRIPTIDQLGDFPLVQRMDGGIGGSSPREVLAKLAAPGGWITPHEGQYWGAGGVEFTSFKFLDARALLVVEGGSTWKVMLLGRVTVDLPRSKAAKKPMASVVVDLAIAYHGTQSLFSMDAVLAPGSYVLDPAAALTGGLSLYIWGEDRTAFGGGKGFVFTLGGYHKNFPVPRYYPRPPRLGWAWSGGDVSIRGEVYAAVTPGAFMAGGRLAASYDKDHGIQLRAWFTAWVDVVVRWKPFYFELSMGLNVGVAATIKVLVRVRVSLEVAVFLDLWGPPIGGTARVEVWFISFTIGIGSGRDTVHAIEWGEFRVQLPAPLAVVPRSGLLADVDSVETQARRANDKPLLVSSAGFVVSTESVIPASKITLNNTLFWGNDNDKVNIRPMGRTGVLSEHKVTIKRGDTFYEPGEDGWTVRVVTQGLPRALWGVPLTKPEDALKEEGLIAGCGTGICFQVPPPERGPALGPVSADVLGVEPLKPTGIPLRDPTAVGPQPVKDPGSIATITNLGSGIGASVTVSRRTQLHQGLGALGVAPGSDGPLGHYAARAGTTFTDPPLTIAATR
jgi:hypothetical protein